MRIDSQVHVIGDDLQRYPLNPPPLDIPPWFERHPLTAEGLLAQMDEVGMDRAVLVQPYSAYQFDNRYTADAAEQFPDRFVAVCTVDLHAPDALAQVAYWVGERGARGIRLFLQLEPDDRWLRSRDCDAVLDEIENQGAVALAAVTSAQLPALTQAARRHPNLAFVLDHCAYPDLSGGPGYPNARGLFEMAEVSNMDVKVSALVFHLASDAGANPNEVAEAVIDVYGAERVMWASDRTVHPESYVSLVDEAEAAFVGLSDAQRKWVFGDCAAARFWTP